MMDGYASQKRPNNGEPVFLQYALEQLKFSETSCIQKIA